VAFIAMAKPFAETDVYQFQTRADYFVMVSKETNLVHEFSLQQNYPNPFNAGTTIEYQLSETSRVQLKIFDILGQEVVTLNEGTQPAGLHRIQWDGLTSGRQRAASGVYLYRIMAGERTETKKLLLLK